MMTNARKGIVRSMAAGGTLVVLLASTLACGASSLAAPTPPPAPSVPAAPTALITLTAGATLVAPGGDMTVSWTTSVVGGNDWIALFKKGDSNRAQSWWTGWTDGATSGTFLLTAPLELGEYQFRYLLDDGYNDAATSNVVTVAAVAGAAYNRGPH